MLRRLILYLSTAGWARNIVTNWGVARRVVRRFVAGETLEDAVGVSRALNQRGLWVTLDYLGESVHRAEDTQEVVNTYVSMIERVKSEGLTTGVSLKLTHLGLDISEDLCINNLRQILTAAQKHGIPATIDMEGSDYTETTLRIFRTMLAEFQRETVGIVIQAYLYRSRDDMHALASEGATVRLCKGAYLEPPTVAFPAKADVDRHFIELMHAYLAAPPPAYLQIASHDEQIIVAGEARARQLELPRERFEFQMLYGIRTARQEALAAEGYQVRVYVPFGTTWYPYFMRRLAERPANLFFFIRGMFQR